MRLFKQKTTILGRYCLFNDPSATGEEDEGTFDLPGIKMLVKGHPNDAIERFVDVSEWLLDDDSEDFGNNFRRILIGEDTSWSISCVKIDNKSVLVRFYNDEYYEDVFIDVRKMFLCPDEKQITLTLYFEAPGSNDGIETVDVYFSSDHEYVTITEHASNKKRIIEIGPATGRYEDEHQAIITECVM